MIIFRKLRERAANINVPVLVQEMRIRQRGVKPFVVTFIYAFLLSVAALLVLYYAATNGRHYNSGDMSEAGRTMFMVLSFAQLTLISLIMPAYSAAVVSAERESGSFDLLALTLLSSASIITQKFIAAILQIAMLTVASLPVLAVVFMLGGVSPLEVLMVYFMLLLTAVMFGSLGVLCSSFAAKSRVSTFVTYLIVGVFLLGIPLIGKLLPVMSNMSNLQSETGFSLTVTGIFTFGCGIIALVMFGITALILKVRTARWKSRSFRMVVFGGIYALIMLCMSNNALVDAMIDTAYRGGVFIPLYVNPFIALYNLIGINNPYSSGYVIGSDYVYIIATVIFSLACTYLFRHIAVLKFNALRRA